MGNSTESKELIFSQMLPIWVIRWSVRPFVGGFSRTVSFWYISDVRMWCISITINRLVGPLVGPFSIVRTFLWKYDVNVRPVALYYTDQHLYGKNTKIVTQYVSEHSSSRDLSMSTVDDSENPKSNLTFLKGSTFIDFSVNIWLLGSYEGSMSAYGTPLTQRAHF